MIPVTQQPVPLPQTQFLTYPPIQGDPAARRFGLIFLGTLALMTIGAGVGIGVGNIAHYRYFPPTNMTYYGNISVFNITLVRDLSAQINSRQSPPLNERLQKRESVRKSREFWLSINKP